jgi:tRNA A-37 threonylcarbamoyl transferase component Bud32
MSSNHDDGPKSSTRDKTDTTKSKELIQDHKPTPPKIVGPKHQRILSTDFHHFTLTGHRENAGSEGDATEGVALANIFSSPAVKKSESKKALKIEHRRVQSSVIDNYNTLAHNFIPAPKPSDFKEQNTKHSQEVLKYGGLTFKRQKNPTDLSQTQKVLNNGHTMNKLQPSATQVNLLVQTHTVQAGRPPSKSKINPSTIAKGFNPKLFPSPSMYGDPFSLFMKPKPVHSKSKKQNSSVKMGKPKRASSIHGEKALSAWNTNIKAMKFMMLPQGTHKKEKALDKTDKGKSGEKPAKKKTGEKPKIGKSASKGIIVPTSTPDDTRIIPGPARVSADSPSRKIHHKKNPSMPVKNASSRLADGLNLPIILSNKGMTMTPDASRRNSPKARTPVLGKGESFIVEEVADAEIEPLSRILYASVPPPQKDVVLDFRDMEEESARPGHSMPSSPNSVPRPSHYHSGPPVSRNGTQERESGEVHGMMSHGIHILQGARHSPPPEDNRIYSENNSHRSNQQDKDRAESGFAKHLKCSQFSRNTDESQDGNNIPMVLQKLMLVNRIKEYYESEPDKDIPTALDFYQLKNCIGQGSFGKVYHAVSVLTGKDVAIKKFEKAEMSTQDCQDKVLREASILNRLDHPNIARMLEVFENKGNYFFVMEQAKQGDLLQLIKQKGPLTEDLARMIIVQVVHGLQHCHSRDVLHRDIKLDNIVLSDNFIAKLCDFGISRVLRKGDRLFDDSGTQAYTAPEVVEGRGYSGFASDVWSLGIVLFVIAIGKVPFKGADAKETQELILKGEFTFPHNVNLSPALKDLLTRMLTVDPKLRITTEQILAHKWFDHHVIEQLTDYLRKVDANDEYAFKKLIELGFPDYAIKRTIKNQLLNHIHCCYQIYKHN